MPMGLEFGLSVILGAFVVLGLVALRRPGLGPMPFWIAGWIAAGAGGVLILAAPDFPRLQFLTFPLGSLFPWLLLAGALVFAGRRVPGWMLPGALAYGLARSVLAAEGRADVAYALALAVEPCAALAAGWVAHRAVSHPGAALGLRLLGPSFVLVTAAGAAHVLWLLLERDPAPLLTALWLMVAPPAVGLQIYAALESTRRALGRARDELERRVELRTAELAEANEALRGSEERYRAISELSSDLSFAFRLDRELQLTLEWSTGAFQRIAGADPQALEGRGWLDFLSEEPRRDLAIAVETSDSGGQGVREIAVRTRDGAERRLEVRTSTRLNAETGEFRVVGSARDVTETRRIEAESRELEHRVHESERLESLGRLSGGIAHDFNNLLSVILGNVRLAEADLPSDAPIQTRLARIGTAADHAARLTDQMLTYAGKAPTDRKVIDVSELLSRMLELVRAALPASCQLDLDLAPDLRIEADETQIQQVVLNLVTNAGEALEGARGRVGLRIAPLLAGPADLAGAHGAADAKPGEYVALEVRDSGRGLDPEVRERIFDPFFTTKFTGRGMGLASTLGIVRSHGGVASLESTPGRGTRARVLLPRVRAVEARPPGAAPVAERSEHSTGRILVVDDDPAVLELASEFLTRAGFTVIATRGGREGIERLRDEGDSIDAVVLDLSMPDVGGEQAFLEMRQICPGLPIVLASGFSEEFASERFRAPGTAGFLRKPYAPEELVECVRAALGGSESRST
jgi:PAS domain S-box-containing protein